MPNSDRVKVAVRVRPFNQREKDAGSRCVISMNSSTTSIHDPKNPSHVKSFTFDLAYWSHSGFLKDKDSKLVSSGPNSRYAGQRDIFHDLGEGILDNAWQGYNATLLAYGQTGSGKSYSMIGHGANRGIIPVICEELFKTIQNQDTNKQYQITFSMLEIYNEQVIDLLSKTKKYGGLKVREDQQQGFYVDGLKLVPCDSYAQIERLMEQGTKIRTTASTSMNTTSSRSHMVITIHFKQIFLKDEITKESIINLVDLAGSERQRSSGSEGDRLKEGTRVNLSLTTLGNVISALAEAAMGKKVLHVPYRDSVLTKLLQSALGGNSRTIMIAAISPADICYDETLSTLRYAERTKKIKNQAVINSGTTAKLIHDLKMENCNLLYRLSSLWNSGKTVVDETKELRSLLAENELRIQAIQATWEYHLEEARKEWEQQYAAITQVMACDAESFSHLSGAYAPSSGFSLWLPLLEQNTTEFLGKRPNVIYYLKGICRVILSMWRKNICGNKIYLILQQERQMMETFPYLVNINEDPQLSGVLKYFIQEGSSEVGQSTSNAIILRGLGYVSEQFSAHHRREFMNLQETFDLWYEVLALLFSSILDKHATFMYTNGKVTISPWDKCKVIVNGVPIVVKTKLQHLDRLILGSNSAYLYIGSPIQRTCEDLSRYDYDFIQSELAAAKGFSVDKLGAANRKDGKPDPSVLAVFHDYIKLMPLVAEANQMSIELKKDLKLELKVKNLASSDSRGYDLQKEIIIKVVHKVTNQVWIWSKPRFINRKFLMEELYQQFLNGEDVQVDKESDPFWDPVEAIHLGSAHIWLQSLAYCMKLEEQIELLNSEGMEEAILLLNIIPCVQNGRPLTDDDMIIDPLELLGKRIDFQIHIFQCLGVKWIKEVAQRGIQIGYKVYDLPYVLYTKPAWKNANPKIDELVQFSSMKVSQDFLNYLQRNALIVDLWGLQEGCAELCPTEKGMAVISEGSYIIDNPKAGILTRGDLDTESHIAELYHKVLKLEEETDLFRDINRALTEENVHLKAKLKEYEAETHFSKILKSPSKLQVNKIISAASRDSRTVCSSRVSCDAEFAKALKSFYQKMNVIRGQFLKLQHYRAPDEDNIQLLRLFTERQSHLLKDFGEQLESSISKLKYDVALIVKKKREARLQQGIK